MREDRRTPIARRPPGEPPKKPPARDAAKPVVRRKPPQPVSVLAEAAKAPGTPRKKAVIAGPKATSRRAAKPEPSELDRIQLLIVTSLEDDKAEGIVTLDLVGRASFADRMVIATGLADRQISAMAGHLEEKLHKAGVGRVRIEGAGGSDWVLLDAGDIVVHLFKPDARALYALERMWGTAALDIVPDETPAV
jgi:ribosome-associated protein